MNSPRWTEPRGPSALRRLTLVATIGLHGLLLAAGWGGGPPAPGPVPDEPQPLQVMLISERSGSGESPRAAPQARGDMGRPMPLPPPVAEPEAKPVTHQPERPALPVTAPDLSPLAALASPRAAIRLRLEIDATGRVERVDILESDPADLAFAQRLAEILLATPHIPARRDGQDVASEKVVALEFGPAG